MTNSKNNLKQKCNANNKSGGTCNHPAGFRTDHAGDGRCYLHGGRAGVPVGNKNAVKTGEFEKIPLNCLDSDEKEIFETATIDDKTHIENAIKLLTIRESRMMKRINILAQKEDANGLILTESTDQEGTNHNGDYDSITKRKTLALDTIIRIEDALTRVQAQKLRYIEAYNKLSQINAASGEDKLDELIRSIHNSKSFHSNIDAELETGTQATT